MQTEIEVRLNLAAEEYLARQDRVRHPDGTFDSKQRWVPTRKEAQDCCDLIRSPSAKYPYSLLKHCRSINHLARLYQVDEKALKRRVRELRPPASAQREGGDTYYKAVALLEDGKMVSLFNGTTEYVIGETVHDRARQNRGGGLYCYRSIDEARLADVHVSENVRSAQRAVIRVRAEGAYCVYGKGKLAFSRLTPLEVVALLLPQP